MNIFKKNNEKKTTQKLPMTGKVQKGFRAYCAVIAAATLVCGMSVTAFAASDPITVVNNLSDFIFGLIRAIGLILLGFGIVQVGLSLKSHDPSQRANGFPDSCRRYHHYLCKGNPDPYYWLRESQLSNGHTWHFRYAPNLKGGCKRR